MTDHPALEIAGLKKSYGPNEVLNGIDLDIVPGEIHALLGENGAGKSTLIKILAGVERRDAGRVSVSGRTLAVDHSPSDMRSAGVAFVHQHLGLVDSLSVADNIALYVGFPRRWRQVNTRASEDVARRALEELGDVDIDPRVLVGALSQDEKVLVALARAFALKARVIVLDEVSASLPAPEMERLSKVLRQAKGRGVAYIYVTHRLKEVYDFADRMTVLRDGRVVLAGTVADIDHDRAVGAVVGHAVEAPPSRAAVVATGAGTVKVADLVGPGLKNPLSFEVRPGEVVGICGLVGSGTREVARLLGGATAPTGGTMKLGEHRVALGHPHAMHVAGCAYVPGQRARDAVFPTLSVRENLFPIRSNRSYPSRYGLLGRRVRETRTAQAYAAELEVKPAGDVEMPLARLSGGNQQKVVLGRALGNKPRLLVLEDPTAGVDVGSRRTLHHLIRAAASEGTAVVLISTDYDEVATEADRVLIMCDGRVVCERRNPGITAEDLARTSHRARFETDE